MSTSSPNRRPKRMTGRSAALSLAVAGIVGGSIVTGLGVVDADPASGEGPLTVDDSGHWFEYADNGEPYFMAGSGGPEGFLYYSDERKQSIVDQLIRNDVRAVYIHAVRSDGGDGGNDENPFVGNNADNGVDAAVLDNWDSYLSQLDDAGIVTWFHLYDDGARPFGACNPDLPEAEQEFVKTIVERFRDYQHLVWLPTEEHIIKACGDNSVDVQKAEALAAEIRKHDDVHPLGVHHNNGQTNQYLGNDDIDVFAQQVCQQSQYASVDGLHDAGEFGEDVYVMSECHPWHKQLLNSGDRTSLRQSFWSSVMAGGYVLFYDAWESNDPTDAMLADLGRINEFMDTTRFSETVPADQLAAAETKWVLGNESSDVYIAYANDNPSAMGIQGLSAGDYDLDWFDPVDGAWVAQTVNVGDGAAAFPVPDELGAEVALSIEPTDGTTPPVTDPPVTDPPVTEPPVTEPPVTDPPVLSVVELAAIEDAYIQGTATFNTDQIRLEHGGRTRVGYLRFDTSDVATPDTVRLDVVVGSDAGNGTITVSLGAATDWTEDSLTPSNAPVVGETLAAVSGSFSPGQALSFDLPARIVDGDIVNLVLDHDGVGSADVSLESSEGGDGPLLVAERENGTEPPTTEPPTTEPPTTEPPTTEPPTTSTPTTSPPTTDPTIATVSFTGTDVAIANPERGFHEGADVADSTGDSNTSVSQMSSMYDDGIRLARMYIRLDDYRDSPIPDALLDNLDEVFANARAAGIKIIPRFSYNFGSAPDAPVERIEQHIDQVTPVLQNNSDVIAVLQAGFIGAWGEWHSSSNGLTNPTDRARVRDAVFEALPDDRMAQFRYPKDLIELEPTPLSETDAWSGSAHSRTGHKNDCFLANEHDAGTYWPLERRGEYQDYLAEMTQYTVTGGETCQVDAGAQRTDCSTALEELDLFNWDYLNLGFFGDTIDKWTDDGCFDEIDARLGYRFEMQSASAAATVAPGGELQIEFDVENDGFGKLYNPRPINVVLVDNATGSVTRIERIADARSVLPISGETATLDLSVDVPANLEPGDYSIHIELPDGSASLAGDPRYSIQMANAGTWRAELGTNDLALDTTVGGSAPDPVDPDPVDPDPVEGSAPSVPTTTPPTTTPPTTAPPTTVVGQPTGLVLVDADSGDAIGAVDSSGSTLVSASAFGTGGFSAVYNGQVPAGGSVRFELSGPISTQRIENVAPYTMFGDVSGDLGGRNAEIGDYEVKVVVYSGGNGQGSIIETLDVSFALG